MDYQKKEKIFKRMLKENVIPELQLKEYAKLFMELQSSLTEDKMLLSKLN